MTVFRTALLIAAISTAPLAFATDAPSPSQPAEAQPGQTETTSAPAAEEPKEDRVVCKKIKTTGSRLPTEKICKKQSEWDAEAAANADATKRDLERATTKQ